MIPLVDLRAQYKSIKKEVDLAIKNVLKKADFVLGEEVEKFEKEFAAFCGVKYAVGLDTGLSSLELGMRALGIGPGDEVLTPANSFIASSSAISFTGAKPILADCDKKTYNIDIDDAEKRITKRTKAIMPVHLYGQMSDMERVAAFAKKHSLLIIEDACQAHGAKFRNKRAGSFGDFAAFSFYPGKNLGAYGDGGMFATDSKRLFKKIKMMRNYGRKNHNKYLHFDLAWNRRLDTMQAAILRVKLKHLEKWNNLRRKHAYLYNELVKDLDVVTPFEMNKCMHIYHVYSIRTKKRDKLKEELEKKGISTGVHYPIPIHLQPAYKALGYKQGDFPVTEKYAREILSLPMFPELKESQIKFIARQIKLFKKQEAS